MGGIASSFGIGGSPGAQGSSFTPEGAPLQMPTTTAQAEEAATTAQAGIANQQAFMQALQAQNGIGNQSNIYSQLGGVANGTGPNPAQAMLAQSTGTNVANQAALMAGQRGAGQNVGLIARQAAQQGANTQQQAVGQAATMQANQSLSALGQQAGIAGQQVGQQAAATGALTGAQQSEQQELLNSINAQNSVNEQNTAALNQSATTMAQTGAAQQQTNVSGLLSGGSSALGLYKGGEVHRQRYAKGGYSQVGPSQQDNSQQDFSGSPTDMSGMFSPNDTGKTNQPAFANTVKPPSPSSPSISSPPTPLSPSSPGSTATFSSGFASGSKQGLGGLVGHALGAGIKALFGSKTPAQDPTTGAIANAGNNYGTSANNFGADGDASSANNFGATPLSQPDLGADSSDAADSSGGRPSLAKGGRVPALVSPGERYIPPKDVKEIAKGKKSPMNSGERIPGKAKVHGDSLKNDVVPKTLKEGGIVLPRSITESKHPQWEAHKFVSAILAKQGLRSKKRA